MKDRVPAWQLHGYIDNSLAEDARRGFEARLNDDPGLRRQVDHWRKQTDAVRLAFGAASEATAASDGRPAPEADKLRKLSFVAANFAREDRQLAQRVSEVRRLVLGAIVFALIVLAPGASRSPLSALGEAGAAAFRAFAASPPGDLDFRAPNLADLDRQIGARHRWPELPMADAGRFYAARREADAGGVGRALLAMFDSAGSSPVGVLIEPLDAPAATLAKYVSLSGYSAATFARDGYGFVIVGDDLSAVRPWVAAAAQAR